LSLLYIWFTLFPGRVAPETWQFFTLEQVNWGRQYNRVLRILFVSSFLIQVSFLTWLVFGGRAVQVLHWTQRAAGGSYWGSLVLFFVILWLVLRLIDLPFDFLGSYYWQHMWGFSTQTLGLWLQDYVKSSSLNLALASAGVVLLFLAMGRWPDTWWLAGAAFISVWLLIQTLLWPVIISPLFNCFEPAKDPKIVNMVQEMSQKAGLPVDQVLVMDASRRTTRANAYFTGLGHTKRIVLYDTLLEKYSFQEVRAVVAHEMSHWSRGHITRGLALGILGNFFLWGTLFLLLRATIPMMYSRPPHVWAVVLLFFMLTSFVSYPLQNYFSRNMEREADQAAVMLTGDVPGAVNLQVNLAARNLSDVAPAPFIQWFSYSHPPALTRIGIIEATGAKSP